MPAAPVKTKKRTKPKAKRVIYLRTSERTSFKRCRWAWDITYSDQLRPKISAPPLRFGTLVHKAMELRYPPGLKRGPHPAETFEKAYNTELEQAVARFGFRDEDDKWHDALALGVGMLNHYVDTFGKDEEWKVIHSEMTFQVPIYEDANIKLVYVGIIDGVWQHRVTKELWIRDWKTAKAIPANHGSHLTLDEQPGSYWAYAPEFLRKQGILKPNQRLQGIDFIYMRKALKDERPQNAEGLYLNQPAAKDIKGFYEANGIVLPKKGEGTGKDGAVVTADLLARLKPKQRQAVELLGEVSATQPSAYFARVPTMRTEAEMNNLRHRVLAEALEHRLVRAGKLEAYKNPGQMTCGGCGLKDICELHESGQDWEAMAAQVLVPWDPYAEHEIRSSELR